MIYRLERLKTMFMRILLVREVNNSIWLMIERIFSMALNLFIISSLARIYGPEEYGLFNYALSFVILFTSISTLGLETISVKRIIDNRADEGIILKTSLFLRLLSSLVMIAVSYLLMNVLNPDDSFVLTLVVVLAFSYVFKSLDVIDYWVQANHLAKYSSKIKMVSSIVIGILKLLVIYNELPIVFFATVYSLESFVIGVALFILYKYKGNCTYTKWKIDLSYGASVLKQSWPMIINGLMVAIYSKIDQIMIGDILNSSIEVGFYSAAIQISSMWYFIPLAIITSFNPTLLKNKNDKILFTQKNIELYSLVFWICVTLAFILSLLAEPIINIIFGAEYYKSISVLTISVWGGVIALLGSARGAWLITNNYQAFSIIYLGIGSISNVFLNYILIPNYGIEGASIASVISQMISVLIVPFLFKNTRESVYMMLKGINIYEVLKNRRKYEK